MNPTTTQKSSEAPAPVERDLDDVTLARAKSGDRIAQGALLEHYEPRVLELLSWIVGYEEPLLEDLAQETFLRVLRALPGYQTRGSGRLGTWILTIATRLALDQVRRDPTNPERPPVTGQPPVGLPRPDQDVERRKVARALMNAIQSLRPRFQAAFLLREVHGLSYEEIAVALDIETGTVKSRLNRARTALQRALTGLHPGG
jgi:RNA polymerase sigma-70 factor (ECF subfamily)